MRIRVPVVGVSIWILILLLGSVPASSVWGGPESGLSGESVCSLSGIHGLSFAERPESGLSGKPASGFFSGPTFSGSNLSEPERRWKFSALTDTTVESAWVPGYGGREKGIYGFEQYGNLRLDAPIGDRGMVYAALNVQAASGTLVPSSLSQASMSPGMSATSIGEGYVSVVELERLYYRLEWESSDWETGLLRIPFGFGQAWRPTDFLNPPNPLTPDARPRGVLGTVYTLYPSDFILIRVFAAGGPDPSRMNGAGAVGGISGELHKPTCSLQAWYAIQAPSQGKERPDHRFGFSYKWDGAVALVLDTLYLLEGDSLATGRWYDRDWNPLQGLQAAVGVDGSWGDFIALVQYLYNGSGVLDPGDSLELLYDPSGGDWKKLPPERRALRTDVPIQELNRKNYLYGSILYKLDDYTRFTLSSTLGLDDGSFVPALMLEHEPFQGVLWQVTLRGFFDPDVWGVGSTGELGPLHSGRRADLTVKVRLRI